jgi:hypothetical protein
MICRIAKRKRRVTFVTVHSGSVYGDLADPSDLMLLPTNVTGKSKKVSQIESDGIPRQRAAIKFQHDCLAHETASFAGNNPCKRVVDDEDANSSLSL